MINIFHTLRIYFWPMIILNSLAISLYVNMPMSKGVIIGISLSMLATFGFLINNIFDIETDKANNVKRLWQDGRKGIIISLTISLLFLSLGLYLLSTLGALSISIGIFISALLILYSIFLRKILFLANISSAFLDLSPLWVPLLLSYSPINNFLINFLLSLFLIFLSREIMLDVKDKIGDFFTGRHTFPIIFGYKISSIIIFILLFAGSILFIYNSLIVDIHSIVTYILLQLIAIVAILLVLISNLKVIIFHKPFKQYIFCTIGAMLITPIFLFILYLGI